MGYEVLISGLIKSVVSPQFESMKMDIAHTPWVGQDGRGGDIFGTTVTLRGLVDFKGAGTARFTSGGLTIQVMCEIMFLDPVADTTTLDPKYVREGPIDSRDKLVLPDGSTAPVADSGSGFANSLTGNPFAMSVTLGTITRGE